MIVKDKGGLAHDDGEQLLLVEHAVEPTAEPPPPFIDEPASSAHQLTSLAPTDSPPQFTVYDASYFESGPADIVSHDSHLNSDGEALYRFLLAQSVTLPSLRLHCCGTHTEARTRWVTQRASDGRTSSRRETYTETVTDFDFYIDATPHLTTKPIHWSIADNVPAYRGRMARETESSESTRKAKRAICKEYSRWFEERTARGFPPWVGKADAWDDGTPHDGLDALKSSKTLRQWADDYCASHKYLKEFVYDKVLYGWNLQQLESLVRASIAQTLYQGSVTVDFQRRGSKIYIRPDNKLSRMLSNKWLKFLSIIFFIFPFVWLFKRFHSCGGGRWEVCGGAYALKRWEPIPDDLLDDSSPQSQPPEYTPHSTRKQLVGISEIAWFRKWESTIIRSVRSRYQSSMPIFDTMDDGYPH